MSAPLRSTANVSEHCFGIFVGVSLFDDPAYSKRPIPNAVADAMDVQEALIQQWGWLKANLLAIHGRVTLTDVSTGFKELFGRIERSREPATCLIFFSTHGHMYKTQAPGYAPLRDLVLLTSDSRVTDTDPITALDGLSHSRFQSYIKALPANRKVIILDACYSAVMPVAQLTVDDVYDQRDAVVLASSRLESRFDKKARNSEFTQALITELQQPKQELSVISLFGDVCRRLRQVPAAPAPILRADSADFVLGISQRHVERVATIAEIIRSFNADTSGTLRGKTSLALDTYIPRPEVERAFAEFLKHGDRPAFTLVAAAGNGKSTSMRELALACIEEGRAVLWFPEPRSEKDLDFERFVMSALPASTERNLLCLTTLEKPLTVFFDGINEWRYQAELPGFFNRVLAIAREHGFRIVIACRELAWSVLGVPFTSGNTFTQASLFKASVLLRAFDSEDLAKAQEAFSKFLLQTERCAFTLVLAGENGKSAQMQTLAARCLEEDHAVLWFPAPRSKEELDFEHFATSAFPALAQQDPEVPTNLDKPPIVFFEGIDEWLYPDILADFFTRALALAGEHGFRLVISCRDSAWSELGAPFTTRNTFGAKKEGIAEISLSLKVFDDEELDTVLSRYPQVQGFVAEDLVRHPIFVAILLHTVNLRDFSEDITLPAILGAYVRTKTERAANRLALDSALLADRVLAISAKMLQVGRDALGADEYFEIAGSAIGTALLDEALFVSGASGITTEVELLLDYLLSRHFARDPLADFESFERSVKAFPRIEGAVLLRLCEMRDEAAVNRHLVKLDQYGYMSMLAAAIRLLPSITPHESVFLRVLQELPFNRATDALRPVIKRDFAFCMTAAKQFFGEVHYYDWELKRWRDVRYQDLRARLDDLEAHDEAKFLFDCLTTVPQEGLRTLLQEWLPDNSPLRDGPQATIAGVASVYIRAFGEIHPEHVLALLDQAFDSPNWRPKPDLVLSIVRSLGCSSPQQAVLHAIRWAEQARYLPAALAVLLALPLSQSSQIDRLGRCLVDQRLDQRTANEALGAMAKIHTRVTLGFVESCADDSDLWAGTLAALSELQTTFPDDTLRMADKIARQPALPASAVSIAIHFFTLAGKNNFALFEDYAEYVLSSRFGDKNLVWSVFSEATTTYSLSDPAVRQWSERWLRLAPGGWAIESLARVIRRERRLTEDDLVWLKEWVKYPNAGYYPDWIIDTDISIEKAADLLIAIDVISIKKIRVVDDRLRGIAGLLLANSRFSNLPRPDRQFWETVASSQ